MGENKQPSRSAILEKKVQNFLESKIGDEPYIQFTRNDIITELSKNHKDEESLFTGVMNRLFEKDDRIEKVSHGLYHFRLQEDFATLNFKHITKVLDKALENLNRLSTNVTVVENTVFTERDREVLASFSKTIKELKRIKNDVQTEEQNYEGSY